MDIRPLSPAYAVSPQIAVEDIPAIVEAGYKTIICNRPDAEHDRSAASSKMAAAAKGLGLAFHYQPIKPGEPYVAEAEKLAGVVAQPGAKVFAYCRSGMRASNAWSLAQATRGTSRQWHS